MCTFPYLYRFQILMWFTGSWRFISSCGWYRWWWLRHVYQTSSVGRLRCVAVCCRVLQSVAVCFSVFQCVAYAVCCAYTELQRVATTKTRTSSIVIRVHPVCCSALKSFAVCCSVLQWGAVYCGVFQGVAVSVCTSVLQCLVRCCNDYTTRISNIFSLEPQDSCGVLQCVAVCCSVLQ